MTASPLPDPPVSRLIPWELGRGRPTAISGRGSWVEDAAGKRYLDAASGGSLAAVLGHGRRDLLETVRGAARRAPFVNNEWLTNPEQEELAARLAEVAPAGFTRVRFTTGGAAGLETAVRMARQYHVERGEPERWRIISPAAHGDGGGEADLGELDRALEQAGPETVSLFFGEPVSSAARPGYSPPEAFWDGLAERRERHRFLIGLDETATGMGRTGDWFAARRLPLTPDIIVAGRSLGGGYAALGAVLCRRAVYEAFATGTGRFALGHTWDGVPSSCAVGLAVMGALRSEGWVEHAARRGPRMRGQMEAALAGNELVGRVRGVGFLLGVEYVDPRDGVSPPPPELNVADRVERQCADNGVLTCGVPPNGAARDRSLLAPPLTASESDLEEMVGRFARSVRQVADRVGRKAER